MSKERSHKRFEYSRKCRPAYIKSLVRVLAEALISSQRNILTGSQSREKPRMAGKGGLVNLTSKNESLIILP